MFDELKEIKFFKKNKIFPERYNKNYFKEITRLKSLQKAKAYLKPKQATTRKLFNEYTYQRTIFSIEAPS